MESELFEHILYRKPSEQDFKGYKRTGGFPAGMKAENLPGLRKDFFRYRKELLDYWPVDGDSVEWQGPDGTGPEWERLVPEENHFFTYETPRALNRACSYIKLLIECESRRMLTAVAAFSKLNERDCLYWVTLSLRKWSDYLAEVNSQIEGSSRNDDFSQFMLTVLELHLMALVCELSERYAHLPLPDFYTPETIYPGLLDKPEPDINPLKATPAWFENRALKLISEQDTGNSLNRLLVEIQSNKNTENYLPLLRVQFLLENAFFLVLYKASFIEHSPGKLEEPEFTADWISGIRRDCLEEAEFERLKENIIQLHKTAGLMNKLFGLYQQHVHDGYPSSEAMQFVREIINAETGSLTKLAGGEVKSTEPVSATENISIPYAQHLKNRFMTTQEVEGALRIGHRNTLKTFLERTEFRYVEISSQNKLIYREDVDEFIKKNTKRFKP